MYLFNLIILAFFFTDEIISIKRQIQASEETMKQIWIQLVEGLQGNDLLTLVAQYAQQAREWDQYVGGLIKLYEQEIKKWNDKTVYVLSDQQKELLEEEIRHLNSHRDGSFRSGDIASRHDLITGDLINGFVSNIQDHCPLITSILESLVGSAKPERNRLKTNEYKFKCASHALAALLNIRSSKTSSDFPLLFGLLCISYGGGKQFINMLNAVGLSPHWDTMYAISTVVIISH